MPTPQTQRELHFEEVMTRAVEAEAVDEEQMRSLMPPEKLSTEEKAGASSSETKVDPLS